MPEYMIFVQADATTESNTQPENATDLYAKVDVLNKEMKAAGVFVDGAGFAPTKDSYRVQFTAGSEPQVRAGPFDLAAEQHVSGFWRIKVKNAEEAVQWARKIPFTEGEVILRRIAGPDC